MPAGYEDYSPSGVKLQSLTRRMPIILGWVTLSTPSGVFFHNSLIRRVGIVMGAQGPNWGGETMPDRPPSITFDSTNGLMYWTLMGWGSPWQVLVGAF